MSSVVLNGATSGSTTITPTDAVTVTCTLPSTGGTLQTSGSGYTTNGVAYASSTSALATGAGLVFDGTNLGLGVTPSAWNSAFKAIQVGAIGSLSYSSGYTFLSNNWYQDATGTDRYITSNWVTNYYQYNGGHYWRYAASGTAGATIGSYTNAMTLDNSGNLLLGTTISSFSQSGASKGILLVGSTNSAEVNMTRSGGSSTGFFFVGANDNFQIGTSAAYALTFNTNNTERARIDSSGNLLVGYTSSAQGIIGAYQTANSTALYARCTNASLTQTVLNIQADRNTTNNTFYAISYVNNGAGTYKFVVADSGNVTNTNNSYGAISDVKLKDNITDATPKLADLLKVQVRNYNLKTDPSHKQLGVVAQELEQVFPSMIDESPDKDKDGNDLGTTTKSVKYSVFVPMLIKAIQELNTLVTTQAETITSMQATITALQTKVGV